MAQVLGPSDRNAAALRALARGGDELGYTWATPEEARAAVMSQAIEQQQQAESRRKWTSRVISLMGLMAGVPPTVSGALTGIGALDKIGRYKAHGALLDQAVQDPFGALDTIARRRGVQAQRRRNEMQSIREAK